MTKKLTKLQEAEQSIAGTVCPVCKKNRHMPTTEGQNTWGWVQCFECATKTPLRTWLQFQPNKEPTTYTRKGGNVDW